MTRFTIKAALLGLAFTIAGLLVVAGSGNWARQRALTELGERADADAQRNVALIRHVIDRYRALPAVLAENADVLRVLQERQLSDTLALDARMEALARDINASAIYLLDQTGKAIVASNWREPATFVGVDYRFRPYFQEAFASGSSEYFAVGTVSHRPGLYFSHRVQRKDGQPLGVMVVKVEFEKLENDWGAEDTPVLVTDENGIILLSNRPEWRFHTIAPLSEDALQSLKNSQQFGEQSLTALPATLALELRGGNRTPTYDLVSRLFPSRTQTYLHAQYPIETKPGWELHTLLPGAAEADRAATNAQISVVLGLMLIALGSLALVRRRIRARQAAETRREIMSQLSSEVAARTAQLELSHAELARAMQDRLQTQMRVQTLQDELAQANKLSLLGQVSAGVAHEINQPLAAIRTYAENAQLFLARDDTASAKNNLVRIDALTDRIARITGELRDFARRGTSAASCTTVVQDAIDGALLLIGAAQRRQSVNVEVVPAHCAERVAIERIRLEQILVNLLQNAMDALANTPDARITIETVTNHAATPDQASFVTLIVQDNGPGLPTDSPSALFTPFSSSKPQGLGLGLVISRDLAREAGGELIADQTCTNGARFLLSLPIPALSQS